MSKPDLPTGVVDRSAAPAPPDRVGRYFCTNCRGRFERFGDCPKYPGEPLLDLARDEIREMLQAQDDATRRRRHGLYVMISAVVSVPFFFLAPVLDIWIGSRGESRTGFFAIALGFGVAIGLAALLMRSFPPRTVLPPITPDELARWLGRRRSSLPPLQQDVGD